MLDRKILVSTHWLAEHLDDNDLRVVDGSWYLPTMGRDAVGEYAAAHIPGAVHFDIDEIANTSSDLPHMLAAPEVFAKAVGAMGISHRDRVVIYDGGGLASAPRVWWNFAVMGAKNVFILDGGLPKWQAEGHAMESGIASPKPSIFSPSANAVAVADTAEILNNIGEGNIQIVDMRSAERFSGTAPEPRAGLRSGHIPNSINLPFQSLLNDGQLRPRADLKKVIADAGIDITRPIISSCGSGVTAAFLNLALAEIGAEAARLYDGSWTEWSANDKLPVHKD